MRAVVGALRRLRAWAARDWAWAHFVVYALAKAGMVAAGAVSLFRPDPAVACQERLVAAALRSGPPAARRSGS